MNIDMPKLSTLSIGNGAFHEAETLKFINLNEMKSIEIGNNKFNKVKSLKLKLVITNSIKWNHW